jgi:hypothetical protein
MSHKLLNLYREIRPNAVWDFIKLGVGVMIASLLGLGYWLVHQYREAPFSVLVMFGIFFTSFAFTFVLFGYQKLKTRQIPEKQWYETPENELTSEQTNLEEKQEKVVEKSRSNLVCLGIELIITEENEDGVFFKNHARVFIKNNAYIPNSVMAISAEFRNEPINGKIVLPEKDVQAQIFFYKPDSNFLHNRVHEGIWLGRKSSLTTFGVGNTQDLLLMVNNKTQFHIYDNKRWKAGHRLSSSRNAPFEYDVYVRLFNKKSGMTLKTFKIKLGCKQSEKSEVYQLEYVGESELPSKT